MIQHRRIFFLSLLTTSYLIIFQVYEACGQRHHDNNLQRQVHAAVHDFSPNAETLCQLALPDSFHLLSSKQVQKLADEDYVFSVGDRYTINNKLRKDGNIQSLMDGGKLYSIGFTAPGATFMDISYNRFHMPEGSVAYLSNPHTGKFRGPYHADSIDDSMGFSTDILDGDSVVLLCYVPSGSLDSVEIELRCIVAGNKGFFNNETGAACLINTACDEAKSYRDIIQSVVLIYMDGYLCSGNLINNTAMDGTPYILTAAHCMEGIYSPHTGSWKFYFNIETYQCDENEGPSLYDLNLQTITGCKIIAKGQYSDFLLLKLNKEIPASYHAYYCGWDRRNSAPEKGVVGIHHPHGDYKKFSKSGQKPTTSNCSDIGFDRMAFWNFYWERGICQQGSSGSGLFNAESQRLIGTLTAITDVGCSTNLRSRLNWYGKMSYHWFANNENSAEAQLRPWLDPIGSNALYMDGSYQPTTVISEARTNNKIEVFPNPATETIRIHFSNPIPHTVRIYSSNGLLIKEIQSYFPTDEISVSSLSKGVYFIETVGAGRTKFVKL